MSEVFFSYHWRDHAAVEQVARRLSDYGVRHFLDRWYLALGQSWQAALEQALARCKAELLFQAGKDGLAVRCFSASASLRQTMKRARLKLKFDWLTIETG
jgi:hypothetical protein